MLTKNNYNTIYQCRWCDLKTSTEYILLKHIEIDHCGSLSAEYSPLHYTYKLTPERQSKSNYHEINYLSLLKRENRNSVDFECLECNYVSHHKSTVLHHIEQKHGNANLNPEFKQVHNDNDSPIYPSEKLFDEPEAADGVQLKNFSYKNQNEQKVRSDWVQVGLELFCDKNIKFQSEKFKRKFLKNNRFRDSDISAIFEQLRQHYSKQFNCISCGQESSSESQIIEHVMAAHNILYSMNHISDGYEYKLAVNDQVVGPKLGRTPQTYNGPFNGPLGSTILGRNSTFYYNFIHSRRTGCKRRITEESFYNGNNAVELELSEGVHGPVSDVQNGTIFYLCQENGCLIQCKCKTCNTPPCSSDCKKGLRCERCDTQCEQHKIRLQRSFQAKSHL